MVGKKKRTFVLDTNVLIHDPNAIFSFEEHNVVIPMPVVEELDHIKSGNEMKNLLSVTSEKLVAAAKNLLDLLPSAKTVVAAPAL